jgi:hypothetical protein
VSSQLFKLWTDNRVHGKYIMIVVQFVRSSVQCDTAMYKRLSTWDAVALCHSRNGMEWAGTVQPCVSLPASGLVCVLVDCNCWTGLGAQWFWAWAQAQCPRRNRRNRAHQAQFPFFKRNVRVGIIGILGISPRDILVSFCPICWAALETHAYS